MATHSSILTWGILRTVEPGGLQSIGLQRIRDMTEVFSTHARPATLNAKAANAKLQGT